MNVFEFDGGVIDENTDRKGEPAKRHHIDGFADQCHDGKRRQNGQRDGDADHQRAAPTAEEEQDHQGGEHGGDSGFMEHVVDSAANEDGLIEEAFDVQFGRHADHDAFELVDDALDDVERGRRTGFEDCEKRAAAAVVTHDVGLHGVAVADAGDILEADHCAVDDLDRHLVEGIDVGGAGVETDAVFLVAELGSARGQDEVLRGHRQVDIDRRDAARVHLFGVEIDHDLAHASAVGSGERSALDGGELGADEVLAEVVELLFAEAGAGERELEDGHTGCVVTNDGGRRDAGRHDADDAAAEGADLRDGHLHFHFRVEVDADNAGALNGLRFDVFDVVDAGGEAAFKRRDDALGHFVGGDAGVAPDDGDDRDVDGRKNIHRHGVDAQKPQNGDEHRHYDERVRTP